MVCALSIVQEGWIIIINIKLLNSNNKKQFKNKIIEIITV